ncbi:sigma-54-dependent Fis family transcriptional regulator [Ketobacter sp. MCCC 1A13808]|uniref:sigma-54-dependent Fis family transcriptional regulator n=1 Tax=Ketobacter sp. MCCC 1A13808 TaxID=2602738 RepID=UPI000F276BDC|nr:sigma-54-dependent Fis family transcriptional regulator [Ketobacter sp. MCCC 1A13808]MVF10926.1 sigma-54-dependent Fis family transcriptional regulator [Ketobacter sp. MCCC 1A13808]RLP56318.1 MAG: sigma-54-dependent Fis family transcriptional regulator [Ketobacter sp.]
MNDIGQLVKSLSFIEEFVETTTALSTERNVADLLNKVLLSARNFSNCEAGRIYVLDVTKRFLELRVSQWAGYQDEATDSDGSWYRQRDFSTLGGDHVSDPLMYCGMTGAVVFIDNIYSYSGFELEYLYQHDLYTGARTQSMVLVPLKDHENQTIGVMELINAKDAYNRRYVSFRPLEAIITAFASQTAVCINNALLIETNQHLIDLLDDTNRRLELENKQLKERNSRRNDYQIIGKSDPMKRVFNLLDKAVDTSVSILLQGETGTGKEVFARAIHDNSVRKHRNFVTQNCAALPEQLLESELFGFKKGAFTGAVAEKKGLFEIADKGTLFLDEIGDMPLTLQSKLLRVLQEGEIRPLGGLASVKVDVRIVAATHCNLEQKIQQGLFREDLFFRLNVFPITLPPLREREADLKILLDHFIDRYSKLYQKTVASVSPAALDLLMKHAFPGNVRELQNTIERAVLLCEDSGSILCEHLSEEINRQITSRVMMGGKSGGVRVTPQGVEKRFSSLKCAVNAYEVSVIEQHLQANNWNQTRTAETLQIPRRTLIDKMSRYNIRTPERKRRNA